MKGIKGVVMLAYAYFLNQYVTVTFSGSEHQLLAWCTQMLAMLVLFEVVSRYYVPLGRRD